MFEQQQRRSRPVVPLVIGGMVLAAGAWFALGGLDQIDILLGGGNPFASTLAQEHHDQPYAESPLAVALRVESELREGVDVDRTLAWADGVARDLGSWMLSTTGADDVHEAEKALWESRSVDRMVFQWARIMQDRDARVRPDARLSSGPDRTAPRLHPDEAILVLGHVAWRLDLDAALVRSPVHHYLHLHEPGGEGVRGVEATCFWRVDSLGKPTGSDEKCQGPKLVFGVKHHPSGAGHIRNPTPLPPGAYDEVAAEELEGDLTGRLLTRTEVAPDVLLGLEATSPVLVAGQWQALHERGMAALPVADGAALGETHQAMAALRASHAALVPADPDERLFEAAAAFARGDDGSEALAVVLEHYDPGPPLKLPANDAHGWAMMLDLEHREMRIDDHEYRVVPLQNWTKRRAAARAYLCAPSEAPDDGRAVLWAMVCRG